MDDSGSETQARRRAALREAGERALAEAEARRQADADPAETADEIGGPSGPEPTRFGDWERKGVVSDF